MAGKKGKPRSPEAIAKQKATLARKPPVLLDHNEVRRGKQAQPRSLILPGKPKNGNPHQINFTGLRDFVAFEVARQLPEIVAAEIAKRFGGGT